MKDPVMPLLRSDYDQAARYLRHARELLERQPDARTRAIRDVLDLAILPDTFRAISSPVMDGVAASPVVSRSGASSVPGAPSQGREEHRCHREGDDQLPFVRAIVIIGIEPKDSFDPVAPYESKYHQKGGNGSRDGFNPKNGVEALLHRTPILR